MLRQLFGTALEDKTMSKWMRALGGLALAAAMTGAALASPEGIWELDTKDTRFSLQLCGDGTQLCGKLHWLSDADYNDRYIPYLDKPMAEAMAPAGPGRWKGRMQLFGQGFQGTITQVNEDQMTLSGCAFLVVCKTYQMYRHEE